jgi:cytidylate kinase
LEDVADWVAAVADEKNVDLASSQSSSPSNPAPSNSSEPSRVLTLSRELGAGDTGFAPSLADRLHLHVFDRELIERDAHRLALPEPEVERYDEQPSGVFEYSQPENHHRQYLEAMEQVMHELAEQGDVVLVGRGGNCFLRDFPRAFHVRLVAPPNVRLHRVMEYRWVRESVAKKLMEESDAQRRRFHQSCFGVDWTDPLEYHVTVNSGRLMLNALDLVAMAAEQYWRR